MSLEVAEVQAPPAELVACSGRRAFRNTRGEGPSRRSGGPSIVSPQNAPKAGRSDPSRRPVLRASDAALWLEPRLTHWLLARAVLTEVVIQGHGGVLESCLDRREACVSLRSLRGRRRDLANPSEA